MAFTNGMSERADDRRFRAPQSPVEDLAFPGLTSPVRSIATTMNAHSAYSNEARASLTRRFTTNTVPTLPTLSQLSPIGQQRLQAAENTELTSATFHKVQLLEKKKLEYEYMKEQRRRFEAEMELFDLQFRSKESEITGLSQEFKGHGAIGHQSEPTTPPPEYRGEQGFPSVFSRPSRYSMTSATAATAGAQMRPARSGSQITSPSSAMGSGYPSKSVPASRRGSDEEDNYYKVAGFARQTPNRPVAGPELRQRAHTDLPEPSALLGHLDPTYLLDEDLPPKDHSQVTSPHATASFASFNKASDDTFPIMKDNRMVYKDLQSAEVERGAGGWPTAYTGGRTGHRVQQSLPANNFRSSEIFDAASGAETPKHNRHSMEVGYNPYEPKRTGSLATPPNGASNGMPKLQPSLSANDIPTLKSTNGLNGNANGNFGAFNSHAENHLQNHKVNMGRIPANAVNRHSRELSMGEVGKIDDQSPFRSTAHAQSALHASAPPFGPALSAQAGSVATDSSSHTANSSYTPTHSQASTPSSGMGSYASPSSYYGGYGMGMNGINAAMNGMNLNGQVPYNPTPMYAPNYGGFVQPYQYSSPRRNTQDSQARVIQQRRMQNHEENMRANQQHNIDELAAHDIVALCKDQYGCRYLQRQIEGRNVEHIRKIFEATQDHVVELMQDPFANYLCQKLLEFTDVEQRTVLIRKAAPQMVLIALNQHGTRALQKMIEFVSNDEQVLIITEALQSHVVQLIQDLNGNHVIQKCLNHLKPYQAHFIFNAVSAHVIVVGTHRHGCCVLQRCIDHADEPQKDKLVDAITQNAWTLVQDPFGNYVVQYILDLGLDKYSKPLCRSFRGHVAALSKQKFSSNVIEKCLRITDDESKHNLTEELLQPPEIENLVRDSFANYVIQTALDHADPSLKGRLVEAVRPVLPSIRQTPYGRRIVSKVQEFDGRVNGSSGQVTPLGMMTPSHAIMSPPGSSVDSGATRYLGNGTSPTNGSNGTPNGTPNGYISNLGSPQSNGSGNKYGPGSGNVQHNMFSRRGSGHR